MPSIPDNPFVYEPYNPFESGDKFRDALQAQAEADKRGMIHTMAKAVLRERERQEREAAYEALRQQAMTMAAFGTTATIIGGYGGNGMTGSINHAVTQDAQMAQQGIAPSGLQAGEPVPPWATLGSVPVSKPIYTVKPNPAWEEPTPGDIRWKYTIDTESSLKELCATPIRTSTMKKKPTPKKKSAEAERLDIWWKQLDKYPKESQREDCPVKERICVVSGEKSTEADGWEWRKPYWVRRWYIDLFDCKMVYIPRMDQYVLRSLTGRTRRVVETVEWLKDNNYVQLSPVIYDESYWEKKDKVVEFYSERFKGTQLASVGDAGSFAVCEVSGKLYHGSELRIFHSLNPDGTLSNRRCHGSAAESLQLCSCSNCGNWFTPDLIVGHPQNAEVKVCRRCYDKVLAASVIRHFDDSDFLPPMPDYESVVLRGKVGRVPVMRMFGIEVELGFNTGDRIKNALDVWDTLGRDFVYIKHDGSITKEKFDDGYVVKNPMKLGFEVVSAPAGINVHRERWKKFTEVKAFKTFRAWDADSCGFHVHVSRDALTPFQIGRILVFMNHVNNRYFVDVVAGRSGGFYTRFVKKDFSDCEVKDSSKYMAVRTNKPATIEFRIFRGTVNYHHIIRNIEFCDAVCDFCAPCERSLRDMYDFRRFIAFVAQRAYRWPLLAKWLANIDLIAKKPLKKKDSEFKDVPLEEAVSERVMDQMANVLAFNKSHAALSALMKGKKVAASTKVGQAPVPEEESDEEP